MAESEGEAEQNEDKEENEQCQHVEDGNGETSTSTLLKPIGITLEWLLFGIFMLHCHVFLFCFKYLIDIAPKYCSKRKYKILECFTGTLLSFSPSMTSVFIVVIINIIGEMFPEIQSWEVCYIMWSLCVSIAYWIQIVLLEIMRKEDKAAAKDTMSKWLLYPFGIKPSEAGDSNRWSIPLVSFAPAMVAGFLANFILEEKYVFQCDHSAYDSISDVCYHDEGVCCIAISSHTAPITFMASLASTILAAWGVIKAIGHLICISDDNVVIDHTEELEMMQRVLSTPSGRKLMKESIATMEEEETKKAESEAGSGHTKV